MPTRSARNARVCNLEELRFLRDSPHAREDFTPLGPNNCLILDEGLATQIVEAADAPTLNDFLDALPCPVIAIAPGHDNALPMVGCDVAVSSERELRGILASIAHAPLASSSLVQVLRATSGMPVADALNLESFAYATLQSGPEFLAWLDARKEPVSAPQRDDGPPVMLQRMANEIELRLNRPSSHNALSVELRDALCDALQLVMADPTIAGAIISGEGRCFSVGGDLAEFGTAPDPATGHAIRGIRMPARLLASCADRVDFRLHGACVGAGVELPAFGRRVTAERGTFFQLPEIKFGLIPGAGGCVSIPRRIGRQRTAYLGLSGRRISAATALRWGLIDSLTG